jgi:hypothetical protein
MWGELIPGYYAASHSEPVTPFPHGPAHPRPDRATGWSNRETDSISEADGDAGGGGAEEMRAVVGDSGVSPLRLAVD